MTITHEEASKFFDAFQAGGAWAESLKNGDVFRGSHGEASHRGLKGNERSAFGSGALYILKSYNIYTNNDVITAIGPR